MRTVKLTIEYEGTNFCGWQIQPNGPSVQGILQEAIRKMTAEENHVIGASRTDAGVHALGQVAHFKTNTMIPPDGFMHGINSLMRKVNPPDPIPPPRGRRVRERVTLAQIAVISAEEAPSDFHAQKSAKGKLYRYIILNSEVPSPLYASRCWHVQNKLDVEAMKKASRHLVGEHDFKSFQASGSSAKDAVRRVDKISITCTSPLCKGKNLARLAYRSQVRSTRGVGIDLASSFSPYKEGGFIFVDISGNGFVYHMVRNVVGTLVLVGKRKLVPDDMIKILRARERKRAGATAPAQGLYLVQVFY